ncbi:MAG: D-aminoacyl-tRNA deacylase [Candidatus Bipolaricaulota bacterium]
MRIVLQRVQRAAVRVAGEVLGEMAEGLVLLVGIAPDDVLLDVAAAARKVLDLRIFEDASGKMNLSARETGAGVMAVSQFTLFGDARKGRRPSFVAAARPEVAEPVFDAFVAALRAEGAQVAVGRFGAHMHLELVNDGPVTLVLELASAGSEG